MQNVYNSTDLIVQSSYTEGMPNVILESLLMQVPVIATDVGGTSEVSQHDYSGYLIPPDNLDRLVEGIQDYLNNPEKHHRMAIKGRDFVCQHFDHRVRVEKINEIYQEISKNI